MQVQTVNVLGDINVVSVSLKFFGGSATLTAEDLGIDTTALPSEVVALGTKMIVNKDLLSGFKAARKSIQRKGLLNGTAFLGGYAMSPANSSVYLDEVKKTLAELDTEVESFLDAYPSYVDAWANAHPAFSKAIKDAAPSQSSVRSRFKSKVRVFKASQPGDELGDGGLTEELEGLSGQILTEIARDVKATWKDRGYGAPQIKKLLIRISQKAASLSFIHSDLNKLSDLIDNTLAAFPQSGKIEGSDYLQLKGLMDLLLDPSAVLKSMQAGNLAVVPAQSQTDQADLDLNAATTEETSEVATATDDVPTSTPTSEPRLQAQPAMDSQSIAVTVFQPDQVVVTDAPSVQPPAAQTVSKSSWVW